MVDTESSFFPENSDVLMTDPFLNYIDAILMDEGADDDATCLLQADGAYSSSYEAIFCSLQDIVAGNSPPISLDQYNDAAYLQQVKDAPNHQAIFSSSQDVVQADSVPTGHHQSKPQQARSNSPAMHSRIMKLQLPEGENRRDNLCFSLNCDVEDPIPRSCEGNLELNDELLTDGVDRGQMRGPHKQNNGTVKLQGSADGQLSSDQVVRLDLSFEDLKLDDVYTSLYVNGPSFSPIASTNGAHKQKSMARKGRFCKNYTSKVHVFVDVREKLISCAEAVAIGDTARANQILQEMHQVYGASAHGTGHQRIAYIFSRALAARMRGMGVQEYEAMSCNVPSSATVLRAAKLEFEVVPYKKLLHYYANQSIVQAARGVSRLHIIDYGVIYGLQWFCLINTLADRKGVPPLLVITFIEFPQPGLDMARRLDEIGQRLAAYAKTYNVPFEYRVIVSDKWEDVDAASLRLCPDLPEVLVVNCMKRLHQVADDTTTSGELTVSARQKLLAFWRSLNPHLLVTAVVNGAHNSSFFVARFREALDFFTNGCDMLDTLLGDTPERLMMGWGFYYRTIMNIVACEGAARVERSETYKQWHVRITNPGFEQVLIPSTILATSKSHVKQHYHKDFFVDDDRKGWMLMGWKGRVLLAISAWKPANCVL